MKVELNENLELAKAELAEKGKKAGAGVAVLTAAGVAGLLALGTFTAFLVLALDGVMPNWAAALCVAALWALVAVPLGAVRPQQDPGSGHARARKDNRIGEGGRGMAHTSDQLKSEIGQTREQLSETADALAYKADVPTRTKDWIGGEEGRRRLDGERGRLEGRRDHTRRCGGRSEHESHEAAGRKEPGRLGDRRCSGRFHRGPAHALHSHGRRADRADGRRCESDGGGRGTGSSRARERCRAGSRRDRHRDGEGTWSRGG